MATRKVSSPAKIKAFHLAATGGRIPEMKQLLDEGVDISSVLKWDILGGSALNRVAYYGRHPIVKFLIEAGADLNTLNANELTPLMSACSNGKAKGSKVAMLLIEAGADVRYVREGDEMTALKFAAKECTPEVIQALIDHGADVDGPRGTDQTAMMLAARNNNVAALKVLVKNGANLSLTCKLPWAKGLTAEGMAELTKKRDALAYLRKVRPK